MLSCVHYFLDTGQSERGVMHGLVLICGMNVPVKSWSFSPNCTKRKFILDS